MSEITINLPEEIFSARRFPEEFVQDMRLVAAIYGIKKGKFLKKKRLRLLG